MIPRSKSTTSNAIGYLPRSARGTPRQAWALARGEGGGHASAGAVAVLQCRGLQSRPRTSCGAGYAADEAWRERPLAFMNSL